MTGTTNQRPSRWRNFFQRLRTVFSGKSDDLFGPLLSWSIIGLVIGGIVAVIFAQLISGTWIWEWRLTLTSTEWFDVARSAIATVGLFGVGGAALLAFRRQGTAEELREISAAQQSNLNQLGEITKLQFDLEQAKQLASNRSDFNARFASISEQLGHLRPAVRLAGVHAMAGLADDWKQEGNSASQKICIEVLCAYLRMKYVPDSTPAIEGEKQVRLAIIDVITARLQDPDSAGTWCGIDLDFTGVVFDGGNFTGAHFTANNTNFDDAVFCGDDLYFHNCMFSGNFTSFADANFVNGMELFMTATFSAGCIKFNRAKFIGGALAFYNCNFTGAQMIFSKTEFESGKLSFVDCHFTNGEVTFPGANFKGSRVKFSSISITPPARISFNSPGIWTHPPEVPWPNDDESNFNSPDTWPIAPTE